MQFRIADTFIESLAKLTGGEQKAVKHTAFDLQLNPANPGLSFHKLDKTRDKRFCSVRVNRDIRLIVHKTDGSLLLCYVDHHDKAYQWAQKRKLETHPKTGAAQIVEIREQVREMTVSGPVTAAQPAPDKPALFADTADADLLAYGVPEEWLEDVRAASEESLLGVAEHLPAEAAEALLTLAVGGQLEAGRPAAGDGGAFEHPDAQRRFRLMDNVDELEQALESSWEHWSVFLHPVQNDLVTRDYNGPARVAGSAGTGKTVVALHRAVYLARWNPEARVLLTTLSDALAKALQDKLRYLIGHDPRVAERLEVHALDSIGERLYTARFGEPMIATPDAIHRLLNAAARQEEPAISASFLADEWFNVVDAWQLENWPAYRDVRRLGRKTRLPESRREALWRIFQKVREGLVEQGKVTRAELFTTLARQIEEGQSPPFQFAVVDEAQDINVPQLRLLAALGGNRPNSLFFAGDLGQRILQTPFSWKSLGADIRGRSRTLKINYRTSHQIRMQADRLLDADMTDVDGNAQARGGTVSVFDGTAPGVETVPDQATEIQRVAEWLQARLEDDIAPHEMALFVRSEAQIHRARAAMGAAGATGVRLDAHTTGGKGQIALGTMPDAKGLEFRAVAVMACDDDVVPSPDRIETVTESADLEEVYATERHLLYVAATRARDHLLITGVEPASEFLDDFAGG